MWLKRLVALFVCLLLLNPPSFAMNPVQTLPTSTAMGSHLNFEHDERSFLRLFSGDTIRLESGEHVSVIGVNVPDFKERVDQERYAELTQTARKWVTELINNPNSADVAYGIGSKQVRTQGSMGSLMVFFYLYMPDGLMEDIRNRELREYYNEERTKKLKDELAQRARSGETADEYRKPEDDRFKEEIQTKRLVIRKSAQTDVSAAKYYYSNGMIKREEVYYDGMLVIKNMYDERGRLVNQWKHSQLVENA
jgi:hypothetical protein